MTENEEKNEGLPQEDGISEQPVAMSDGKEVADSYEPHSPEMQGEGSPLSDEDSIPHEEGDPSDNSEMLEMGTQQASSLLPARLRNLIEKSKKLFRNKRRSGGDESAAATEEQMNVSSQEISPEPEIEEELTPEMVKQRKEEEERKKQEAILEQSQKISSRRKLQFVASVLVTGFLFLLGSLFSGAIEEEIDPPSLYIEVSSGKAYYHDDYLGEEVRITGIFPLHEKISFSQDPSSASTIVLSENGAVRVYDESSFVIDPNEVSPKIDFEEGNIWVFSPIRTEIETDQYVFTIESGSARIQKGDGKITIFNWENSMPVVIKGEEGETLELSLPAMSRAVFPESSTLPIAKLKKLRTSKLQKEFHVQLAIPDENDHGDIKKDAFLREKLSRDFMSTSSPMSGLGKKVRSTMTFIGQKKNLLNEDIWETEKSAFYVALKDNNQEYINQFFEDQNLPAGRMEELLSEVKIIENSFSEKNIRHRLEDEILKSLTGTEATAFEKSMIRNSFHALQKSIDSESKSWKQSELSRIKSLWAQKIDKMNVEEKSPLLTLYRGTLFRFFVNKPAEVNEDLLAFLEYLDNEELNLSDDEKDLTQFEILQKSLILSRYLVTSENLMLARSIFEKTVENMDRLDPAIKTAIMYKNLMLEKDTVKMKLDVCETHEACTDAEYTSLIQSWKALACELSDACDEDSFQKWLIAFVEEGSYHGAAIDDTASEEEAVDPGDSYALATSLLEGANMTLDEGEKIDDEFFQVSKATTDTMEYVFSGVLSVQHTYLKDVKLLDGTEIPGTHSIGSLESAIYLTLNPDDEGGDGEITDPVVDAEEENEIDPVLADLIIRNLQQDLLTPEIELEGEAQNIVAFRTDMEALDTNKVRVNRAEVGSSKVVVSFDFTVEKDTDKKFLQNVEFEDYPEFSIDEVLLEDAISMILGIATQGEEILMTKQEFGRKVQKYNISFANEDISVSEDAARITFQNMNDGKNMIVLSGEFDMTTEVFLSLEDEEGVIGHLENIPLADYGKLFEASTPEEASPAAASPVSSAPSSGPSGTLSADEATPSGDASAAEEDIPSEASLIEELSKLFLDNGFTYDSKLFEADAASGKVFFVKVFFSKDETFLSGEYDSEKKKFVRISGSSRGTLENITLEEFLAFHGI